MEDNNIPLNTELGRQVTTKPSKISWELWSGLSTNMAAAHNSMMYNMLNIMQSMQQTVLGLQNTVINLVAEKKKAEDNSLDTTMVTIQQQHFSGQGSTSRSSGEYNLPQSEYGTMASHQVAFQFLFANPNRLHSSSKCCMRQAKEKDLGKERCQSGRTLNIQVWVSARKIKHRNQPH